MLIYQRVYNFMLSIYTVHFPQVISFNTAVEATEKDLHVAPGRGVSGAGRRPSEEWWF